MSKRFIFGSSLVCSLMAFMSCDNSSTNEKAAGTPIVLGNPATIITETDSNYLKDMVVDLKPSYADIPRDTIQSQAPDSNKTNDSAVIKKVPELPAVSGLNINFKEVAILIPGVEANLAGKTNLQKANSATYQLVKGKLDNNKLQVSSATITKVSQRYQSTVSIKNNLGTLDLSTLGSTSAWKPLKGSNGTYIISGLDAPAASRINQSTLKSAISREARQQRMSRKTEQQWQNSVKSVSTANQKPLVTSLRAVMWKIDGKDINGRSFSKQIRIDL